MIHVTASDIAKWVENTMHEGFDYRALPGSVQVIEDPQVRDTFAVQFDDVNDSITQLLFICGDRVDVSKDLDTMLEDTLEEVEFESWPPVSGDLKFFT